MTYFANFKKNLYYILEGLEEGKFKKRKYGISYYDEINNITSRHAVTYRTNNGNIYTEYEYKQSENERLNGVCLEIDSCEIPTNSFITIGIDGKIIFKFHPLTLERVLVKLYSDKKDFDVIPLQEFLTEEQYFMYNTLYDLPTFDFMHSFLILIHELRGCLLKHKFSISGAIMGTELPELHGDVFLDGVKFD